MFGSSSTTRMRAGGASIVMPSRPVLMPTGPGPRRRRCARRPTPVAGAARRRRPTDRRRRRRPVDDAGAHAVHEPAQAPPRHQAERLDHDERRHLRLAGLAVDEADRHLGDGGAVLARPVRHLDLEAVALGPDAVEVEPAQDLGRVGPVPRRRVGHAEAEHRRRVAVAAAREEVAVPGPVRDGAALDVARADRHVEALVERRHQRGQRGGVVREVGVDLDAGVVAALEAPGEAGAVGAAEPGLGGARQQVHVGQLGGDALHDVGRAVGTAVVDHQHAGTGQALVDPVQHPLDVLRLVVGRDDDQRSHGGILGEAAAPTPSPAGAAAGPGSAPGLDQRRAIGNSRRAWAREVVQMSTGSGGRRRPELRGVDRPLGPPAQLPHDHLDRPADGDADQRARRTCPARRRPARRGWPRPGRRSGPRRG